MAAESCFHGGEIVNDGIGYELRLRKATARQLAS
jgi:hypothetical protein